MPFAEVALHRPLRQTFQYRIPDEMEWQAAVGALVEVEFGKSTTVGCVTEIEAARRPELTEDQIRPIVKIVNPGYFIPADVIELARWMADYYYCGIGEALHCASMIGFNEIAARKIRVLALRDAHAWRTQRQAAQENPDEAPRSWTQLTPKQRRLVEAFLDTDNAPMTRHDIADGLGIGASVINRLIALGALEEKELDVEQEDADGESAPAPELEKPISLNPHQSAALAAIRASIDTRASGAFLLHGVTGSGKTEIYLQAIARVLELGRQAVALVPEIALTPQTVERFERRFGPRVGVYHSRLTLGEKHDLWRAIQGGRVTILVGARSALFAPFPSLGLIIVDEEHETTYKQSDPAPRYHARDVAIVRGRQRKAPVILGSATPSMESYRNSELKKYTLLKLPHRVSQLPMATTRLVDMREEVALRKNVSLISQPLRDAIAERLTRREQTILFLNRRGFSNFQICWMCRAIPQCQRCDVSLTYHKGINKMVCHYCDRSVAPFTKCPQCGSDQMQMVGMGTERIEELLREEFADARLLRMDLDTTSSRDAFVEAWRKIRDHQVDIILGTQMIAKGLHVENVTLVGVVSADFPLFQPDFRAAERAFCLLTQVTGRAGRGEKPGEVIIQTYQPRHYSIVHATRQDYEGFYQRELRARELMRFPPYQRLISLLISDKDQEKAHYAARGLATALKKRALPYQSDGLTVFSATPAPIARLRGRFRYLILLRGPNPGHIRAVLDAALEEWRENKDFARIPMTIDVDPVDLM